MKKLHVAALFALFISLSQMGAALAATLLPNGEQVFLDNNGAPLSGGSVYFYLPNTTTPKDTWQDPDQGILNTNPVVLDSAGRAIIYGSGEYRQIVTDADGNLIWDQLTADTAPATGTAWGGTSGGTGNNQVITAPTFVYGDGQALVWIAGGSNTGATVATINSDASVPIVKGTPSGPGALTGGEIVAGNLIQAIWDGSELQLIGAGSVVTGPFTNLASATTTNLGTIPSHNVTITGTTTIASFGSSASTDYPLYNIVFSGALTLTYNASSMILPSAASIVTVAGDSAVAMYLGSGNWRVISYSRGTNSFASGVQGDIPYFGASGVPQKLTAGTSGYFLQTQGASANPIWATASTGNYQAFTSSGTWTKPASASSASQTYVQCWGAGGGGGSGNTGSGGGGGGAYSAAWFLTSSLTSTVTVTVGSGGAAATAGGNSSFGSYLTAYGGGGGVSASQGGGGGGGGFTSAGANGSGQNGGDGGGPVAGTGGTSGTAKGADNTYGGGGGGYGSGTISNAGGSGGNSWWGGGGGAGSRNGGGNSGGTSIWGGGGGGASTGTNAGTSVFAGAGGAGGFNGTAPGGGGGGGSTAGTGARGECRAWTSG
jgi:hypothetical protein